MLIVFEGIDGAGKKTQIRKLLSFFRQNRVKYRLHKYPTKKAKEVFEHLGGKKTFSAEKLVDIFAGDILREKNKIEKEISSGFVVICDRYLHSTLAYQGVKLGFDKLGKRLEALGAPVPDLVILLDVKPETGVKRKYKQKMPDRFEKDRKFLEKVRKNYLLEARKNFFAVKYAKIDASSSPDIVFSKVITAVEPLVIRKIRR